jgi:hypothetical protein
MKPQGNSFGNLVGAWRFELQASCAQGRRATRLRYAPTFIARRASSTALRDAPRQPKESGRAILACDFRFAVRDGIQDDECATALRLVHVSRVYP